MGFAFWPPFKDFACGRARVQSVPKMLPFMANRNVDWKSGDQDVPQPCPLTLLLPSAPVAPPEAPPLVELAIVLDSWAAVISESAVMTIQNAARDDWTNSFC